MTMNSKLHLFVLSILLGQLSFAFASTQYTVEGDSAFDNRINKILHWDGTRESLGIGPDILAGISIVVGIIAVFFGYRLIRPAIFVAGFMVGSVVFFIASEKIFREKSYVETACWIAFVLGGLIVGFLVLWLYSAGIFLIGALAGVLLATQIQTSFGYAMYPSNPQVILIILMVICGLACGVIAIKLERPILIIATAWIGAVATMWGIGFFAGGYPNAANLRKVLKSDESWEYDIPNEWWGYLAGTIVLAVIGMYVQFRMTPEKKKGFFGMFTPRQDPGHHV